MKYGKPLIVPVYVQELMQRARYEYDRCAENENYGVGYTVAISKATPYARAWTLKKEVERLCKWANRTAGVEIAHVLYVPDKTHYHEQSAVVTIFDPVMKHIEQLIPENARQ